MSIDSFHTNWVFFQNIIFCGTTFNNVALLDSTHADTLFLKNCFFRFGLNFKDGQLEDFVFTNNSVNREANFINVIFTKSSFANSVFNEHVNFKKCTFKAASFTAAKFRKKVIFTDCLFDGIINFDSCVLQEKLSLPGTNLTQNAGFTLNGTILPDTIDLSGNTTLANVIDFTKAAYKKKGNTGRRIDLYLYKTDLSKIQLDYRYFKLIFRTSPDSCEISNDEKEKIYEGLLNNFKAKGYLESYRLLDIEYQRFRTKTSTLGFLWWIPEYWWNYGYNKEWIFYWVIGFILVFTTINFFIYNWIIPIYQPENLPNRMKGYTWERLWFGFVYTGMIFFSFSLKIDRIKVKNKGGTLYLILLYSLGLVCIAYMANFVIQK